MPDSFYEPLAPETYRSTAATVGPWDAGLQHGGPPAALLGHALENAGSPAGSRIARIAFDFFSPVPVADLSTRTEVVRPGRRIQLSAATLRAGGRVVLRATAWHVLAEAGRSPDIASSFVVPALPARETEARFPNGERFGYGDALEWRFVRGGFGELGAGTVWTRARMPLIAGEPLSGLERVLVMADAANGVSAALPLLEWTFVPIDLLIVVQRLPATEWVGMSCETTMGADGIGTTENTLFDGEGAFGRALQTLYVERRA